MTDHAPENKWRLTPGVLIALATMLISVGGAWMSFESRITQVESDYKAAREHYEILSKRFDRFEDKLDRLIERSP